MKNERLVIFYISNHVGISKLSQLQRYYLQGSVHPKYEKWHTVLSHFVLVVDSHADSLCLTAIVLSSPTIDLILMHKVS